ncbi:MAG: PIN domain-containing protein [Pseudonocardia sp.]|nr:PIN domain-containing protein [Pseudonocardia sp.]
MRTQFADTSFWYARHVAADRNHATARTIRPAPAVLTTEFVLGETWTLVRRRVGHAAALACVRAIRRLPGVAVEPVTGQDHARAWQWLEQHDEREYSFVDAVSFAVMTRLRLTEALAFDGDFAAAGFVEVRSDPA